MAVAMADGMVVVMRPVTIAWQWSSGSKSKNQEGGNKGRAKIKRGRTKRKSFQLHNLDVPTQISMMSRHKELGLGGAILAEHGIGWGDFSRTKCVCV
jgi:hypothetical protein